ncbi:PH domain-containing protein [Candidatus Nitrospira bockiana]
MTSSPRRGERIVWDAYPSWYQFVWLYFFSLMTAFRAALFYRFDVPGWHAWLAGTLALLACAALLRRWAHYIITPTQVIVQNGYTGRYIQALPLDRIGTVDLRQGPIASLTGIGTLVIRNQAGEEVLRFRGIREPEVIRTRLNAMKKG